MTPLTSSVNIDIRYVTTVTCITDKDESTRESLGKVHVNHEITLFLSKVYNLVSAGRERRCGGGGAGALRTNLAARPARVHSRTSIARKVD